MRRPLDALEKWTKKGIDGFITTGLSRRRYHIPYEIHLLDAPDARAAVKSPRVYVECGEEIIRVSIDEDNPRILEGDEKDCPGADFTEVYNFIKEHYDVLMAHWSGKIDAYEMYKEINNHLGMAISKQDAET